MRCFDSVGGSSSTAPVSCDVNYITSASAPYDYGMDTSTTGNNITSTFGDVVATSAGPVSSVTNQYKFAATAGATTPAGVYKANLAMIATGSF
jgi:hypothetical protein